MRIPDWVVYAVVLAVIVGTLFSSGSQRTAMTRSDVQTRSPESDSPRAGTAAIAEADLAAAERRAPEPARLAGIRIRSTSACWSRWATPRTASAPLSPSTRPAPGSPRATSSTAARASASPSAMAAWCGSTKSAHPTNTDLALLITDRAPVALQLDLDRELRIGEPGYHVGFPQGLSGEAVSILESRSNLVTRGRYAMEEPVLAWAEQDRSEGIEGTLSGMSGGPVFDRDGAVIGVTVAESPRRGRIYTASPGFHPPLPRRAGPRRAGRRRARRSQRRLLCSRGGPACGIERAVVKVLCRVSESLMNQLC